MTLRTFLILLTLFLSLSLSADRTRNDCPGAWSPTSNRTPFGHGLGVNIHFTDPKPGEIKMISAAGFRWVRMAMARRRELRAPAERLPIGPQPQPGISPGVA